MSYQTSNYQQQGGSKWVVGGELNVASGGYISGGAILNKRQRFTIAEINAGATLLPAIPGKSYRMVAAKAIAVGGAAGAVTTVDITGTVSTSRKLVAFAQANLTQSAVVVDGGTGGTVLADGASYTANDAGTAILVGKTGSNVTTATHIDVIFDYVVE